MEPESTRYSNLLAIVEGTVTHHDGMYKIWDPNGDMIGSGPTVDGALAKAIQASIDDVERRESKAVETLHNSRREAYIEAHNIYAVSDPDGARTKAKMFLDELRAHDNDQSW